MSLQRRHIEYELFEAAGSLPPDEQELLLQALDAAGRAHAPYSGFQVGCALALAEGQVLQGNNQENAAYPSGLCAERTAFFHAGASGLAQHIHKVAIRAFSRHFAVQSPQVSCGACLQVMVEYEKAAGRDFVLLMQGESGAVLRVQGIRRNMLPFSFDDSVLRKS